MTVFAIPPTPLGIAFAAAIGVLALASLICLARAAAGPSAADRLAGLFLAMMNAIAMLALLALIRSDWRYLDMALVLASLLGALPIAVGRLLQGPRIPHPRSQERDATHAVAD